MNNLLYNKIREHLINDYNIHKCVISYRGFTPDFNELKNNNVKACPIYGLFKLKDHIDHMLPRCIHMLSPFNLFTTNDDVQLVPHNSFILHNSVIHKFLQFTKNFILIQKADSQFAERYLGYIIYSLNIKLKTI